jgi:hypothetical protein
MKCILSQVLKSVLRENYLSSLQMNSVTRFMIIRIRHSKGTKQHYAKRKVWPKAIREAACRSMQVAQDPFLARILSATAIVSDTSNNKNASSTWVTRDGNRAYVG